MNNYVFGKTMKNVRNHRNIKLVTSNKRRERLVLEPNYHSYKKISDHLMTIVMKKTRVKMNKLLYLGMLVLDISKMLIINFSMITLNQSMWVEQNFVIRILIALLLIL